MQKTMLLNLINYAKLQGIYALFMHYWGFDLVNICMIFIWFCFRNL